MNKTVKLAALIYGVSILLSRVIGLIRESVIGRILGDQPEADVYWVAFILPDFLNYLLAGGALSLVLIPLLQTAMEKGGAEAHWLCFWRIATPLSCFILMATGLLWFFTPELSLFISPGFDHDQIILLTELTRIILPAQIFHVCGGLVSATLQAKDRHLAPALSPLIYTGCIILGGLFLGPTLGAKGFAWGVLIGSLLGPFLCPLVAAFAIGLRPQIIWTPRHPEFLSYLWRALPVMLGFSIVVLDDMLVKRGASSMGDGVVSQLHYARTLMKVPMGVFGLAMGMATFPSISRLVAQNKQIEALGLLRSASEVLLVLVAFSQVMLTLLGVEATTLIWGRERLSTESIYSIGFYCSVLSLGLWGWSLQGLFSRGFYAKGQTWLPTLVGSILVVLFYPLYVFMGNEKGLRIGELAQGWWGIDLPGIGLALTSSIAISVYVLVLWYLLCRSYNTPKSHTFFPFIISLIKVEIAAYAALWIVFSFGLKSTTSIWSLLYIGGCKAILGIGCFVTFLWILRVSALHILVNRIRQKLIKH